MGKPIQLDLGASGSKAGAIQAILAGSSSGSGTSSEGILQAARSRPAAAHADTWVIEAGVDLINSLVASETSDGAGSNPVLLSYGRLDPCRQNFSHEMNTMHKDLADADAVFDRLRQVDISPWCPAEVAADPAVKEFVRSLYLSGNGAVILAILLLSGQHPRHFAAPGPPSSSRGLGSAASPSPLPAYLCLITRTR
jgi:hypothetical protein